MTPADRRPTECIARKPAILGHPLHTLGNPDWLFTAVCRNKWPERLCRRPAPAYPVPIVYSQVSRIRALLRYAIDKDYSCGDGCRTGIPCLTGLWRNSLGHEPLSLDGNTSRGRSKEVVPFV
jgi:hypothetical protein